MAKTISICIPCYNSEKYIRTTIESALAQSLPADEILMSDDRSPDRSFEIVKEYEGVPRVRILRPPQRTTLGGHYRFLLEQATRTSSAFFPQTTRSSLTSSGQRIQLGHLARVAQGMSGRRFR